MFIHVYPYRLNVTAVVAKHPADGSTGLGLDLLDPGVLRVEIASHKYDI